MMLFEERFNVLCDRNKLPILFFCLMVFISQIFLPAFNFKYDLYPLSKWWMYSAVKKNFARDISWDGGKTFLFRDYRKQAAKSNINLNALFNLVHNNGLINAPKREKYKILIEELCRCSEIKIYTLDTSLYEHFVKHNVQKIIKSEKL